MKFLPDNDDRKIIASIGYINAAICLLYAITFFNGAGIEETCPALTEDKVRSETLVAGIAILLATALITWLVLRFSNHGGSKAYAAVVLILPCIITLAATIYVLGYGIGAHYTCGG